jgi:CelD/BcsL family acetyltransferase involved in cellulose biosynthesis
MNSLGRIALPTDRAGRLFAPAGESMRVAVHPLGASIERLAVEWTALAGRAAEPNAYAEHWFVAASLPAMAAGRDVRLLEVRRGDRLIGVLPMANEKPYGRLPVAFAQNWSHHHSFLGTPLVEAGEERAFWAALLAALDETDWARNFLHLRGLVENGPVHLGLVAAARDRGRRCAIVHRRIRALLDSNLGPAAYYERAIRQKKRKELRRLRARLAETGALSCRALDDPAQLGPWCDAYLGMEAAGWKGAAGTALAGDPRTARFFRNIVAAAWGAGRLQFLRLDAGDRPVAMLVNFLTPPGSFSFKTVFDESFARFSPGVLIQIENLNILDRPDIGWMDSCAMDDHPMIDSLWEERRAIIRVTVRLKGARRSAVFALCRALEIASAAVRRIVRYRAAGRAARG